MSALTDFASLLALGFAGYAAEEATLGSQLTTGGHWELVEPLGIGAKGSKSLSYGPGGIDVLIFTADGSMCAIVTKPSPRPPNSDVSAYCGQFQINESERYVVFDVAADALPNDLGDGLKRFIAFDGDILTIRTAKPSSNVVDYTLTWKRVD